MDDTAKYLIHTTITADGVVERSDVVGAIFGQTEGLLGDELDLRDLQQSSKVGRIDVQIDSEHGRSYGHITIATTLDKVETAILAASLETISRVGPCQARVEVTNIEDVREAKRREVVERAKELLSESFDESIMTSTEILEEVREAVRVEDITDFEGLPAGPRVVDADAIIVVEGRADVLTLLRYGIKNAVAVEGTNVPEAVAGLTEGRTVTAFLDGDRGGELILRELAQVGDVDYVAFAPEGRSVEDLSRSEVMRALREKVPFDGLADDHAREAAGGGTTDPRKASRAATDAPAAHDAVSSGRVTDGATEATHDADSVTESMDRHPDDTESSGVDSGVPAVSSDSTADGDEGDTASGDGNAGSGAASVARSDDDTDALDTDDPRGEGNESTDAVIDGQGAAETGQGDAGSSESGSLRSHVREVIGAQSGLVRLVDDGFVALDERPAAEAFAAVHDAEVVPLAVILDGELGQRVLDVAAQRGVEHVVARSTGEFVKQPVGVRIRTAEQLVVG